MDIKDIKNSIIKYDSFILELNQYIDISKLLNISKELEITMSKEGFWNNKEESEKTINKLNIIKEKIREFNVLNDKFEEIKILNDFFIEDNNEIEELIKALEEFEKEKENYELKLLLSKEHDNSDAILEIHPGAGGVESQDWALMLYRMYKRYAENNKYKVELIEYSNGEEAGIKSATLLIKGINAYGYLKSEKGVHRLVRISPFDSNKRRHTSFASVDVTPYINNDVEVVILPEDLKIDTYRSGGAGGQSVNTTDSAVRIKHIPTNLVVTCQNERSQIQNREQALKLLKAKIYKKIQDEKEEELMKLHGEKNSISWGSQIRSYVFHPYSMIKDHRTKFEISNVASVMDGNIEKFLVEYLKYINFKENDYD